MMPMHDALKLSCCECRTTIDYRGKRMPRGWKRVGESLTCAKCWQDKYVLRAITFPVAGPLDAVQWPELRAALATAWGDTTRLANWLVNELYRAEGRVRMPTDAKLWPAPNPYLYPHARAVCPDLATQCVVATINTVARKYNEKRYNVLWVGKESLPNYRYPVPYPVPAQAWSARWLSETERVPIISLPIQGTRYDLRLRGGSEFRRQLVAIAQLIEGNAVACECALYQANVSTGAHRPGTNAKTRLMAKLVMWLPRRKDRGAEGVMTVRRGETSFIVAELPGRDPWILHADNVRTWIIGHRARLDRMADDTKYEKRWPKNQRRNLNEFRAAACDRQNDRINTFAHRAAKMLAEFAARQGVAEVVYNQDETPFLPSFPWFNFAEKLSYKLRERGIALTLKETPRVTQNTETT